MELKNNQFEKINELISETLKEMSIKYEIKVRQLSLLSKLSKEFIDNPAPEKLINSLLDNIFNEFTAQYCSLLFINESEKNLQIIAYKESSDKNVVLYLNNRSTKAPAIRFDNDAMYKCIKVGEIYYRSDAETETNTLSSIFGSVIPKSLARIPLKTNEKTFGIFEITQLENNYFTEDHARLLNIIGNFISLLLFPFYEEWHKRYVSS